MGFLQAPAIWDTARAAGTSGCGWALKEAAVVGRRGAVCNDIGVGRCRSALRTSLGFCTWRGSTMAQGLKPVVLCPPPPKTPNPHGQLGSAPSKGKRPASASASAAPAPSPAQEEPPPPPPLPPAAEVEVRVDDAGFHGSWFEATVVRLEPERGRPSAARYTVAYSHLAADGGGAPAASVAASHVRPRPPSPSPSPRRFRPHDVVEAFHRRGWWSGVVFPSPSSSAAAKSVTVAFPITREVITVPHHYVRPRRDYVGGEWVPSQTAVAVQPARAVRVYEAGEKVEAVRDREPYGSSWFPATVTKAVDGLSYIVEYSDEEEEGDKVKEYLHWQYIRPAVDRHWAWEDGFQIAPGSAVEAYCDGAWSPGVSQANLRRHSASGKRPSSPVEVTSSDDEHSHNPKNSAIKKAKKEPQLLQTVLAIGSEHASVSKVDSSLPALLSKSPASNHSPSSCLLSGKNSHLGLSHRAVKTRPLLMSRLLFASSGYPAPPDKSMPTVSENPVNEDTLSNMVLPRNQRGKTNPIEAFKGNNDSFDNVSDQTNQGSSRKVVTHLKRCLDAPDLQEKILDGVRVLISCAHLVLAQQGRPVIVPRLPAPTTDQETEEDTDGGEQ
ncbi:uncharacterized protein C2845_PM17G11340 [Panicum miliaceum]|uniref:Agenet domain-containing protein n=1 Tax=Panicum miliaceum TaxID=4540 RepID=A0A3L6Q1W6_PANMI|nr:uncharacterized protein C2845_PM17G11340 [Panicum miliaceum]